MVWERRGWNSVNKQIMAGLDTVFAFFFGIVLAFLVLVVKNACSRESTSSERNSLLLKSRDKHSRLTVSERYGEVDELDVDAIDLEAADMYAQSLLP